MAQEIYNEGRVVGFSAWEIFAREAINNGVPPEDVPDEHKWLAAMLGMGSSLILKIPAGTLAGIQDFPLPNNSNLSAAGIILASPFIGECEFDATSNFAKKVTSYGPTIKNVSGSGNNPPTQDGGVPEGDGDYIPFSNSVTEFIKITDGIIYIKNAQWINTASGSPYKDINPDFNNSSTSIRLYIANNIVYDTYVLFTGFNNKRILQGISGYAVEDPQTHTSTGGSADVNLNDWFDGGMLGPEIIPWASKIIFTVPSSAYALLGATTRTIPSDSSYGSSGAEININGIKIHNYLNYTVKTEPIIDFDSINLTDYYTVHSSEYSSASPLLQEDVSSINIGAANNCNEVVAWYPGMTAAKIDSATTNAQFFPPALYASQITEAGTGKKLVPLDVAAPGTIKCFNDSTQAYNYTQVMPYNFAIYHNPTTNAYSFVINGDSNVNHWQSTAKLEYLTAPKAQISASGTSAKFIALTNSSGTDYTTTGASGTLGTTASKNLIWDDLLSALTTNKSVDLLGTRLHKFSTELNSNNKIGVDTANNPIAEVGTAKVTLSPGATNATSITSVRGDSNTINYATLPSGSTVQVGTNFIKFGNGLKLYISATEPDPTTLDIPVGSIGIGWVNS